MPANRIFVDVREPQEYARGHVKDAINLPPAQIMSGLPKQLADVPKDTEIVLYCLSGARSGMSMNILARHGFTNLVNGINLDHIKAKYGQDIE